MQFFFNSTLIKGFVVAITCCFINRDVRIEFVLTLFEYLNKIKCLKSLRCMSCLNSDYIRRLKYLSNNKRDFSIIENIPNPLARREQLVAINNDEENAMLPTEKDSFKRHDKLKATSIYGDSQRPIKHSPSIISTSTRVDSKCCSFLFGNRKNDFFNENKNFKKNSMGSSSITRKSLNKANGKITNTDNRQSLNLSEGFNSKLKPNLNNKSSISTTITTANMGINYKLLFL